MKKQEVCHHKLNNQLKKREKEEAGVIMDQDQTQTQVKLLHSLQQDQLLKKFHRLALVNMRVCLTVLGLRTIRRKSKMTGII
jgi:hypothetical protein